MELPPGLDGKRRRKVVRRKSKQEALSELRKIKGELSKSHDVATSSITLERWSEQWLADVRKKRSPSTVNGYVIAFREYINPLLGRRRLDKITPSDVRRMHEVLFETPKDKKLRFLSDPPEDAEMLSSTYILLIHNTLSGALKGAVREGIIASNVCERVDRPQKRVAKEVALTIDEYRRVFAYVVTRPDGALWATYLLTGARRNEVIGLEVDRVSDVLDISWQMQRIKDISQVPESFEYRHVEKSLYLTRPKSQAGWRTPPVVDVLKAILDRHIGDRTSGLVFTDPNGGALDPAEVSKQWRQLLIDAGVNGDVKLHGVRHTTVDFLYEIGTSEHIIMQLVGHSTRGVTRGYKTRGNVGEMKKSMEGIVAMLQLPQK
ncbi:tyrosine-type recombinase/integrase [Neomicrococcus aestuarii]|uniref:tyrosine-type recombinase/integrase n=1 Tax=Neomicrococcus aestuarii TaxID=556325 RepID=UPI001607871D|nr:site-specific integrase [Neomicrococcus aestuarii]